MVYWPCEASADVSTVDPVAQNILYSLGIRTAFPWCGNVHDALDALSVRRNGNRSGKYEVVVCQSLAVAHLGLMASGFYGRPRGPGVYLALEK